MTGRPGLEDSVAGLASVPIQEIVRIALETKASDIHLKAGMPPVLRIDGNLRMLSSQPIFDPAGLSVLIRSLLSDRERQLLEENLGIDVALEFPGVARVRLNVYNEVDSLGCALRLIPLSIPSLSDLALPTVIGNLIRERSGLILVTGVTGAGKSTTLAAMIDQINKQRADHIYTIEDPIEFVHQPVSSIITQREIGSTASLFSEAVKSALRADPNVLLIGEMRDRQTVLAALNAAETGLLVFSTLHTNSATKSIKRLLGMFEGKDNSFIRQQLAYCLRAVICQQLVPSIEGGRRPIHEVMVVTDAIQEAILEGDLDRLQEYIRKGACDGMGTMDDALHEAYVNGLIEGEVAQSFALNGGEMARKLRGASN